MLNEARWSRGFAVDGRSASDSCLAALAGILLWTQCGCGDSHRENRPREFRATVLVDTIAHEIHVQESVEGDTIILERPNSGYRMLELYDGFDMTDLVWIQRHSVIYDWWQYRRISPVDALDVCIAQRYMPRTPSASARPLFLVTSHRGETPLVEAVAASNATVVGTYVVIAFESECVVVGTYGADGNLKCISASNESSVGNWYSGPEHHGAENPYGVFRFPGTLSALEGVPPLAAALAHGCDPFGKRAKVSFGMLLTCTADAHLMERRLFAPDGKLVDVAVLHYKPRPYDKIISGVQWNSELSD
jgi:hypothetical protein